MDGNYSHIQSWQLDMLAVLVAGWQDDLPYQFIQDYFRIIHPHDLDAVREELETRYQADTRKGETDGR